LNLSVEVVRKPQKPLPENVAKHWAQKWAKEGKRVDWQRLMPPRGFRVLPRRWVVERTFAWISHNRRMAKDYERLCARGGLCLRGDDAPDGEEISPCVEFPDSLERNCLINRNSSILGSRERVERSLEVLFGPLMPLRTTLEKPSCYLLDSFRRRLLGNSIYEREHLFTASPLVPPSLVSFLLWTSGLLHQQCGGKQDHLLDAIP
jgi:hypothetical protein